MAWVKIKNKLGLFKKIRFTFAVKQWHCGSLMKLKEKKQLILITWQYNLIQFSIEIKSVNHLNRQHNSTINTSLQWMMDKCG